MSVDVGELRRTYLEHVAALQRGYEDAMEAAGVAAVALHSGSQQKRTEADDQFWPLRPVPHFQQWLPLNAPDCALVLQPDRRPRLIWPRSTSYWERPAEPEWDGWREAFEIIEVTSADDVRRHLPREGVTVIGEQRTPPAWSAGECVNPAALVERLDQLRVHKTPYEVLCLAEANRRAALGHLRVREAFFTGEHAELDLHLLFLLATHQDDPETPYKNIVALGPNAATLHHIAYGRAPSRRPGESLLIDAGAGFLGYGSDVTRTYVKGTGFAAETFGELLRRVEGMQQGLCAEVQVGLPYPELHERAHARIGGILADLGVVRMRAEEIVAAGITRTFFPHGLGHSLGVQCHDVGCAEIPPTEETDWLRNTTVISRDQVFSVEPGVYFIGPRLAALRAGAHAAAVDWGLVDELATLGGVRIEDDVHVVGSDRRQAQNLTRAYLP